MRPAKTQISLGILPDWSESSFSVLWVAKDPLLLHADTKIWADLADARADLSLRWVHWSICWFWHAAVGLGSCKPLDKWVINKSTLTYLAFVPLMLLINSKLIHLTSTPGGGGAGISGMNLVQVCSWASSYPPYKCILEYGKSIPTVYKCINHHRG